MIRDFLGTPIKEGDRGIRVSSYGHMKEFVLVTIVKLDETRHYHDSVGIISDDSKKIGWTYPERIIVQDSLSIKI